MLTKQNTLDRVLPELKKELNGRDRIANKKEIPMNTITTTINGEEFTLDHDAIARNAGDGVEYYTTGQDSKGNIVEIVWDTLPGWDWEDDVNFDNEENACDWDVADIEITGYATKYYVCDSTSNTGEIYIDENGKNVALLENAQDFETEKEAQGFANKLDKEGNWSYVSEE